MKAVVVSGGTATNSLVDLYSVLFSQVTYVIPISDNGGSTSEVMRVIGGPAIGDIRSRITKLMPTGDALSAAMARLFSYRLSDDNDEAEAEWNHIVDGKHALWDGIEPRYKEMIRPFFVTMHVELLKKSRPGREFRFERASIGNLFLSGARLFCGSLDSAIELLCKITSVPSSVQVVPVLNTNFSYHISAELANGTIITGQSQISHPSQHTMGTDWAGSRHPSVASQFEDAQLPFSHPDLAASQIVFSKTGVAPLASPIRRIFYINPYGQEIHPKASTRVLQELDTADAVIYSIGSLYTSVLPVVVVEGFARHTKNCRTKIIILNGESDRETSYLDPMNPSKVQFMTAFDYLQALVNACEYSRAEPASTGPEPTMASTPGPVLGLSHWPYNKPSASLWTEFVTDAIHLTEPAGILVDTARIEAKGVRCHHVPHSHGSTTRYDPASLEQTILRIMSL